MFNAAKLEVKLSKLFSIYCTYSVSLHRTFLSFSISLILLSGQDFSFVFICCFFLGFIFYSSIAFPVLSVFHVCLYFYSLAVPDVFNFFSLCVFFDFLNILPPLAPTYKSFSRRHRTLYICLLCLLGISFSCLWVYFVSP